MKFRSLGAVLLSLGLVGAAAPADATLVNLGVTGGPGIDQGQLCLTSVTCPGAPSFSLTGNARVIGNFVFDDVLNTVDFTLQTVDPVLFGGTPSFLPGGIFTATGIPVIKIPTGGGSYQIVQIGPASGTSIFPVGVAPFVIPTSPAFPAISGLTCQVGTGADQCGVSFGPGGAGFGVFDTSTATNYQTFLTVNVNVPEPTTLALVGLGSVILAAAARRRA